MPDNQNTPLPDPGWPIWKLALVFYPFAAAAVAINLFMLGLIFDMLGYGSLSPMAALAWSIPLGVPATWAAGRWVRGLMDEAQ